MVFRDHNLKRNLYWKYVAYETIAAYQHGISYLQSLGWRIKGIVCDGRRGIFSGFGSIPIQMCQYHQIAIITRYITRKPKLEAGKELKTIVSCLPQSTYTSFSDLLDNWYSKWKEFLSEKAQNSESGKWHYVHKKTRSAYRSLKTNLPYLFTYQLYPDLNIPNTTNSLEGVFANLKRILGNHRGLKSERKIKYINEIMAN